jgi:glycosyltransferase involved in cell wall biosynthesis
MKIFWVSHILLDEDLHSSFDLELVTALSRKGHSIHLVVPSIRKNRKPLFPLFGDTKYLPTTKIPFMSLPNFWVRLFFYLSIAIKKRRPDAIVVQYESLFGALTAVFLSNVKLIVDFRSPPAFTGIRGVLSKILYYLAINVARRFCDGITVTSSAMKREMCRGFGIDPVKIGVVTVGVSTNLFDGERYRVVSEQLRKQFNLHGKFIVMYHGFLDSTRGLQEAIEAIAELNHSDIVFFILGSGPFEEQLMHLIAEKGVKDSILIHKPVHYMDVPKFLSICDVGIVPWPVRSYHYVNSPLKLLEYLSMGKPVIATDVPFVKEVLNNDDFGILIPSNSPDNISIALMSMYNNRETLDEKGKKGRAIVEQHYGYSAKSKDIEAFLAGLQL